MASGTSKLDAAAAAPPASRSRRGWSTMVGATRSDDAPVNSTAQAMIGDMIQHVISIASGNVAAKMQPLSRRSAKKTGAPRTPALHAIEQAPATTTSGLTQHDVEPSRRLHDGRQLADGQPERGGFKSALEVAALEGLEPAPIG